MMRFKVADMSCHHCVRAVTDAVGTVDAAAGVAVDLGAGEVTVQSGLARARERILEALAAAGYPASALEDASAPERPAR